LTIDWTRNAKAQLLKLDDFIFERSPKGAERVVNDIYDSVNLLQNLPFLGRDGRVKGTREIVISKTPYVVAYRIQRETIQILAVIHGAQRWPETF
jgi:toxin ParE1/3/4